MIADVMTVILFLSLY